MPERDRGLRGTALANSVFPARWRSCPAAARHRQRLVDLGLAAARADRLFDLERAVIALTRAMAADHGLDGIRVNCVAPGSMYTPRMTMARMTPAGREASLLGIEGEG